MKLYKSTIWSNDTPTGDPITVDTLQNSAIVHDNGLLITCNDGLKVNSNYSITLIYLAIIRAYI